MAHQNQRKDRSINGRGSRPFGEQIDFANKGSRSYRIVLLLRSELLQARAVYEMASDWGRKGAQALLACKGDCVYASAASIPCWLLNPRCSHSCGPPRLHRFAPLAIPLSFMTQAEYISALFSIIVGLGVTDLARSVRELVRPKRTVDWNWLPLLWAATTLMAAIQLWWNSFDSFNEATSVFFFPFLAAFLVLYLTCAFALPDPKWERPQRRSESAPATGDPVPLDLKAFYFSETHRRWYFGLFIAFLVTGQIGTQTARAMGPGFVNPYEIGNNVVVVVLLGTLIGTDRWWVHVTVSVLVFLVFAWSTVEVVL